MAARLQLSTTAGQEVGGGKSCGGGNEFKATGGHTPLPGCPGISLLNSLFQLKGKVLVSGNAEAASGWGLPVLSRGSPAWLSQAWSPSASSGLIIFMASFLSQRLSYPAAQLSEQGGLCNPDRSRDRNPLGPGSSAWHRQESPGRPEKEPSAWVLTSDSWLPGVSLGQLVEGGGGCWVESKEAVPDSSSPALDDDPMPGC